MRNNQFLPAIPLRLLSIIALIIILQFVVAQLQAAQAPSVFYKHLIYLKDTGQNNLILSQVMVDEKMKRLGSYQHHAELMKAQLFMDKGLYRSSAEILKALIETASIDKQLKNETGFYLGKSYYYQSQYDEALKQFSRVNEPVSAEVRAELQHLKSLIMMKQGNYKQAAQYLRKNWWQAPENWDLYARLNLGVALIHSDDQAQGFELLKQLGEKRFSDEEAQGLVDKANQALGYVLLNQDEPEQARRHLEKVRLQGPYSNLALLGAGWASARLEQFRQAIIPWSELQKKDIRDIPVQESMLTLPYALERMGNIKQSVKYYQRAVKIYETEMLALAKSMQSVESNDLQQELMKLDVTSEKAWFKSVDNAGKGIALRYMKQMIDDEDFFRLIVNYREARLLEHNASVKIARISDIQTRLLSQAGVKDERLSISNRDQIRFIEILVADLLKRSNELQLKAQKNITSISEDIRKRTIHLLSQRKTELDVYLVQSRLALAQSYDRLKLN